MKAILFPLLVSVFLSVHAIAQDHHHHSHYDPVELNDGERWKANTETTENIQSMQAHLKTYSTAENGNVKELHTHLFADFEDIFAKCTMKGKAHDQLHNYLLPLRDMLVELDGCEDCNHALGHIEKHLESYSTYFE